jgi:predicted transcriptional regulator
MSDRITIRVDGTMKRIIENIATTERKSASQIIRDALYDYFEDFEARG